MKRYMILLMILCLSITGCQVNEAVNEEVPLVVEEQEAKNESELLEALTLADVVGSEIVNITKEGQEALQSILDEINQIESDYSDDDEDALDQLYDDFRAELEKQGILTTNNDEANEEDTSDNSPETGIDFEPWDAKSYLGLDYKKLNDVQIKAVEDHLDAINKAEENYSEETVEAIKALYMDLNVLLKSYGIKVPMTSYEDFFEEHPGKFTQKEQNKIIALDEEILKLNDENPESEKLESLYESLEALLAEKGFDAEEIMGQLETGSVIYAKFKYNGADVSFVGDKSKVSPSDMDKYKYLINRAIKVMTPEMKKYLSHLLINSDGQANILAFVRQENDALTKWRMVLDLKDAFDADGNYIEEFDTTIVHEFGHLLTLNAGQMQAKSTGTYETDEGILSENSFLNGFYQKFWPAIKADFDAMVDPNDQDSAYEFYEQYPDQFVSDYAATNPEEDIAETFRVFVYSEKPSGDTIKDQKVKWMFEQADLMKIREMIRSNYGIK